MEALVYYRQIFLVLFFFIGVLAALPSQCTYQVTTTLAHNSTYALLDLDCNSEDACSLYGAPATSLRVEASMYGKSGFSRIRILDPNSAAYEIPGDVLEWNSLSETRSALGANESFSFTQSPFSFSFSVPDSALGTNVRLVELLSSIVFSDSYIEFSLQVDKKSVLYGLGEHRSEVLPLNTSNHVYTLYNANHLTHFGTNLYSSYPFLMFVSSATGLAGGAFLANSNAMDVVLNNNTATFRISGGIADLYLFLGQTVYDVHSEYLHIIGKPFSPPLYSFGFHQCRWGYQSAEALQEVIDGYKNASLPLDVQWSDLDYMDGYKDFTMGYDANSMNSFLSNLKERHMHWIPIVDPSLSKTPGYAPYDSLISGDLFIPNSTNNLSVPYVAHMWPGDVVFPDFYDSNVQSYWSDQTTTFHKSWTLSGIWLDKNEPTCDPATNKIESTAGDMDIGSTGGFVPGKYPLNLRTIDMGAPTAAGIMYDVHNLFGFYEMKRTYHAIKDSYAATSQLGMKRPFVLSRSTWAGSGRYGAHWLGDNNSTYLDMRVSVVGVLSFALFGIPMTGADICGFFGNATDELCARWYQLGTLYPFSRTHNNMHDPDVRAQEPYMFSKEIVDINRASLERRYRLIPYMYSEYMLRKLVWLPLFFEFPTSERSLFSSDEFLIGRAIVAAPVLYENAKTRNVFLPGEGELYYDFLLGSYVGSGEQEFSVNVDLTSVPLFVRGGSVFVCADVEHYEVRTTYDIQSNPYVLEVYLDTLGKAQGEFYLDDGQATTNGDYLHVKFSVEGVNLLAEVISEPSTVFNTRIGTIRIHGVSRAFESNIIVSGVNRILIDTSLSVDVASVSFSADTLEIGEIPVLSMGRNFSVEWDMNYSYDIPDAQTLLFVLISNAVFFFFLSIVVSIISVIYIRKLAPKVRKLISKKKKIDSEANPLVEDTDYKADSDGEVESV